MFDFLFVTEFLPYLLRLRRCERKSVEVAVFRSVVVTFGEYLTGKGVSPTNHCWCQNTRVIVVSCGTKISAVHHLVLSQYTRLTDGRTNGQTELRQQYRALRYMQSHGKTSRMHCYMLQLVHSFYIKNYMHVK